MHLAALQGVTVAAADTAARRVDVLQVGTRNVQNYALLKQLGQLRTFLLLKRGVSASLEEWLMASAICSCAWIRWGRRRGENFVLLPGEGPPGQAALFPSSRKVRSRRHRAEADEARAVRRRHVGSSLRRRGCGSGMWCRGRYVACMGTFHTTCRIKRMSPTAGAVRRSRASW